MTTHSRRDKISGIDTSFFIPCDNIVCIIPSGMGLQTGFNWCPSFAPSLHSLGETPQCSSIIHYVLLDTYSPVFLIGENTTGKVCYTSFNPASGLTQHGNRRTIL